MIKAVILVGGPQKGTRFRPLSLDVPKPLFPVAGQAMVQHHIEACSKVKGLQEILLLGYYGTNEFSDFVKDMMNLYSVKIRYLQEYAPLGTAGGIYHFRDQICFGNPESFIIMNGDVCMEFPLQEMLDFHHHLPPSTLTTVLATEATRQQSQSYGCIVEDKTTHEVLHYVEKPSTFVSTLINCGIYICSPEIFSKISQIYKKKQLLNNDDPEACETIQLEQDILMPLAGTGKAHVYTTDRWWSQVKTAGSAIYANRHYLKLYRQHNPERLAKKESHLPDIIGDVFIHPTATVHETAVLGPNVSVGKNVTICAGVRVRESIILGSVTVQDHSCILYSVVGWNSSVGEWSRLEGTPSDPNPNKAFAKMENLPLFNLQGKLNPSICILGCNVKVPSEIIVRNSIVLPHKGLVRSIKNEIIL